MKFTRSLRVRVAAAFAAVGGGVALLLAAGLYVGAWDAGERLIDETLAAEMQDYRARRARNPHSLPPTTATLVGYVYPNEPDLPAIPSELKDLSPGNKQVEISGVVYRVLTAHSEDTQFWLLYNETLFRGRQLQLTLFLVGFVTLMVLASGGLAWWLAGRVIEPVSELARRVRKLSPDSHDLNLAADFAPDEVGELAKAFAQSFRRLGAFVERERAFTADVSHELRTPLAVIQGATEVLLSKDGLDPSDKRKLERIERAASGMADMGTALLAIAREQDEGEYAPVDLAGLLKDVVDKHRHLVDGKPVKLLLEIKSNLSLRADPTLLFIVFSNLISNALSYTVEGEVQVVLDTHSFSVADTGFGISQDALGKVFNRHYKSEHSSGSGIGLSLVKKICERYGWAIQLASEEGRGTRALIQFSPRSQVLFAAP